ncbi:MAG: hypothetical protein ACFFDR_14555 [Candidatus Thorarchaeota archaeon]
MQVLESLRNYLTDWKNLLTHATVGILLVLIIFFIPVDIIFRVAIFLGVIAFNILRMRRVDRDPSEDRPEL